MSDIILLVIIIILALIFSFLNGFQGSAKIVATMISSRAMTPRAALSIAAVMEFIGPFLLGVAVAKAIADIADPNAITAAILIAALSSAVLWSLFAWYFGIPSSSSHALIGGLFGAVAIGAGLQAIQWNGLTKIALALLVSPLIGFAGGFIMMRFTLLAARGATPKANIFFKKAQIPTAMTLALGYGANDAQKTMGVITMGLVVLQFQDNFAISQWVVFISAFSLALGTAIGGWRIIHTLGAKFYRIRPIHAFTSQLTSATVVFVASLVGGPVSTTHIVSTSILGVGSAQRISQVRWGIVGDIALAWILTVPVTALMAAILYFPIKFIV